MVSNFRVLLLLPFVFVFLFGQAPGQTIQQQIDAIFARPDLAGNVWTGMAVSENGDLVHYSSQPDTPRIPASNAKLTTTAAAFALLGPGHTFESRVYANGTIAGGVLTGDLNLVVEHDITWSTRYFSNARTPLNHIANRVRTVAGITQVTGTIRVYGASVYNHDQFDNLNSTTQTARNNASASAFRDALIANSVSVGGSFAGQTGFSPPGNLVYTHQSSDVGNYTLDRACAPLNKISINPAADMLLRHIGYKMNGNNAGSDTYAAGRIQVEAWMASAGVPVDATGFVQFDGSGLSSNNRQTARQLISLLRYMRTAYPTYDSTLTISCTDGTLGGRLCGTDTTGRVHGKTGSLSSTISLSGYVRNRHNNQRVYFSFLHNRTGGINQAATRVAIDDAVRVLAGMNVPIFNPPAAVDLYSLRLVNNPSRMLLQWSSVPGATTYRIYRSIDGGPFSHLRDVNAPTILSLEPIDDSALYAFRVAALNNDGEGPASSAMVARTNTTGPLILMVRGTAEVNPVSTDPIPGMMRDLSLSLGSDIGLESAPASRVGAGNVDLTRFDAVLWFYEQNRPEIHTLTTNERNVIQNYLSAGRPLMISGSKLASNLDPAFGGTAETGLFLNEVLRHEATSAAAGATIVNSAGSVLFEGINLSFISGCTTPGLPIDMIEPIGSARRELVFQPGAGGSAAVSFEDGYRLVVFPVPFDCITLPERRAEYMERIISFLIPPPVDEVIDFISIH